MFKIWGAKNRRTNLHKHLGPPFQIRGGPGSFSNAGFSHNGLKKLPVFKTGQNKFSNLTVI